MMATQRLRSVRHKFINRIIDAAWTLRGAVPDNVLTALSSRFGPQFGRLIARLERYVERASSGALQELDNRLWAERTEDCIDALTAVADDEEIISTTRFTACFMLARWSAACGDYEAALRRLDRAEAIAPRRKNVSSYVGLRCFVLCRLRRGEDARALIAPKVASYPFATTERLLLANSWNHNCQSDPAAGSGRKCLDAINTIYEQAGLATLKTRDPDEMLSMDNIESESRQHDARDYGRLAVIVPAFDAAKTLVTALRSIAEQTYRNLDVVIVDDCSADETAYIAEQFCKSDRRFRLIRRHRNSGSYACRNAALKTIDAPYTTIHDADDWSHPQKLERQMDNLVRSKWPYNLSIWARCTTGLEFVGNTKPFGRGMEGSHASSLFVTSILKRTAGWHEVRISADTELMWRIERLLGYTHMNMQRRKIMTNIPLTLGRALPNSLTRAGPTSIFTIYGGVRRDYRKAALAWHKRLKPGDWRVSPDFQVPEVMKVCRKNM